MKVLIMEYFKNNGEISIREGNKSASYFQDISDVIHIEDNLTKFEKEILHDEFLVKIFENDNRFDLFNDMLLHNYTELNYTC
jgi:hypothetical protein